MTLDEEINQFYWRVYVAIVVCIAVIIVLGLTDSPCSELR